MKPFLSLLLAVFLLSIHSLAHEKKPNSTPRQIEDSPSTAEDNEDFKNFPEEEPSKVVSFGHLVTGNSKTLLQGTTTIGTLLVGYGATDWWTFGTSPLAFLNFNMLNTINRFAWPITRDGRISFEHIYFKTYNKGRNSNLSSHTEAEIDVTPRLWQSYEMETHVYKLTYSQRFSESYSGHLTFSYYEYHNDDRPFSLRMDPQNKDDHALSLTSLHEIMITDNFRINPELGIWGFNYTYPYFHGGLSIQAIGDKFLLGFGMTATYSPFIPSHRIRAWGPNYTNRISYHPELQLQLFL